MNQSHPLIRDGKGQEERHLPAILPAGTPLDERSIGDTLDFIYRFARQVNYYDAALNRSDWVPFFHSQIPFQIARIARFDVEGLTLDFEKLIENLRAGGSFREVDLLMDSLLETFNQIESWRKELRGDSSGMFSLLDNLIQSNLGQALRQFIAIANAAGQWQQWSYTPSHSFSNFLEGWPLGPADLFFVDTAISQQKSADRYRIELAAQKLEEIFDVCRKALREIVAVAPARLHDSLLASDSHEPHAGLLYAFLGLFDVVRQDLNNLTALHLRFFYQDVLRIGEEKAIPDKVHLLFQLAKNLPPSKLDAGSLFRSGLKDSLGNDILYKLHRELIVDNATVASLRTLFLDSVVRPPKPDQEKQPNLVKGIYMAPVADSLDGAGEKFQVVPTSWETLGEVKSKMPLLDAGNEVIGYRNHPFATLGLLLASDVFLAREGRRKFTITLSCTSDILVNENIAFGDFQAALTTPQFALTEKSLAALEEAGENIQILPEHLNLWVTGQANFQSQVINNAAYTLQEQAKLLPVAETRLLFFLSYSGEKEWVSVAPPALAFSINGSQTAFDLQFVIDLEAAWPALLPFDPAVHLFPAEITRPAFRLLFNPEYVPVESLNPEVVDTSPYHLLRFVSVKKVQVKAEVQGLKGVVLQNDGGVLDVKKPFLPFGPQAKVGAEFFIGSREVFQKNLESFKVKMTWVGVPPSFALHYAAYRRPAELPARDNFLADLHLLKDAAWNIQLQGQQLFSDQGGTVVFEANSSSPVPGSKIPKELTNFDVNATDGFLRLTLHPQDFLHAEYPVALSRQMLAKGIKVSTNVLLPDAVVLDQGAYKTISGSIVNELMPKKNDLSTANGNFIPAMAAGNPTFNFALLNGAASAVLTKTDELKNLVLPIFNPNASTVFNKAGEIDIQLTILKAQIGAYKVHVDTTAAGLAAATAYEAVVDAYIAVFTPLKNSLQRIVNNQVEFPIPNEPYTPAAKDLSIDYVATAEGPQIEFYHLHPYDGTYLHHDWATGSPSFLPLFTQQGSLHIGLKDLRPGGALNLLFQMVESTADPYGERACVEWHYLRGNEWLPLRPGFNILHDATEGLLTSGIIEFSIPWDIDNLHTILPAGFCWLRASVSERAEAVSETLGVFAQAALAVFADDLAAQGEHLAAPLDAGLITKSVESIGFIKQIQQPFASFDGKPAEPSETFNRRVSERLRHKGRAITLNDWETLVLHHFPEVYKVKCITHTLGRRPRLSSDVHLAPGFVTVAVIPDLSNLPAADRLEPKLSLAVLEKIEAFLKRRCSPFVHLKVLNPRYERVRVEANIRFAEGLNRDFYISRLKKDLLGFLSPWTGGESEKIQFGGTVFKSALLKFVEDQFYVDYLTDFRMIGEDGFDHTEITGQSARSILVSGQHAFTAIEECPPEVMRTPDMIGLGYSEIGRLPVATP